MSEVRRRRFDKEFKLEAVRLVVEEGRPVAEVSRGLVLGAFCPGSVRINHLARNQQFKYNTNNNAKQRQYGGNLGALSA